MKRETILKEAAKCVCGGREHDYGKPEDNFATIAEFWSAYLGIEITSVDVTTMMALLKIARIKGGGTLDCFIDLAGYAACGGAIASYVPEDEGRQLTFEDLVPTEGA